MTYKAALKLFGNRIRNLRRVRGLTQEQLAELLGKTVEHISFIERGKRSPSFELIQNLSKTLDVSVAYLMNTEDFDELENLDTPEDIISTLATPIPIEQVQEVDEPVASEEKRKSDLERLQAGFQSMDGLLELAKEYGIFDIFQDNNGKLLQLLIVLGLRQLPGRTGNDAIDAQGKEYEIKTINVRNGKGNLKKSLYVTTNHHLNEAIIDKYRNVEAWYIGIYDGVKLIKIYKVDTSMLDSLFSNWLEEIKNEQKELNNRKISMKLIKKGHVVYCTDDHELLNLI